jgi:DUF971 family protein
MKPLKIQLHRQRQILEVELPGKTYELSAEYLRVFSPSAAVQGHSPEQRVLQVGKLHVAITQVVGVGNYAVKLVFDDGHDSGIYTWKYLAELGEEAQNNWARYEEELQAAGKSRDPHEQPVRLLH